MTFMMLNIYDYESQNFIRTLFFIFPLIYILYPWYPFLKENGQYYFMTNKTKAVIILIIFIIKINKDMYLSFKNKHET